MRALCVALALVLRPSSTVDVDANGEPALGVRASPVLYLQVLPQSGAIAASRKLPSSSASSKRK